MSEQTTNDRFIPLPSINQWQAITPLEPTINDHGLLTSTSVGTNPH